MKRLCFAVFGGLLLTQLGCDSDSPWPPRPAAPPSYYRSCCDDDDCEPDLVCVAPFLFKKACTVVCTKDTDCPVSSYCAEQENGEHYCTDYIHDPQPWQCSEQGDAGRQ
ncbi:MAG TPA: hypothetical protein VHO25_15075 [Polyangiaceae bacterium]|nr:hypothetical protein [Polyangiaceae bacterium]